MKPLAIYGFNASVGDKLLGILIPVGGERLDEPASLLVVQDWPEERNSGCSVNPVHHRIGAEGQKLPGHHAESTAEQRSKSSFVLGGTTDEKVRRHCQALLPVTGDEPLLSVASFSSVSHICA